MPDPLTDRISRDPMGKLDCTIVGCGLPRPPRWQRLRVWLSAAAAGGDQ